MAPSSSKILRAAIYAAEAHRQRRRKDIAKPPCINHPLAVNQFMPDYTAVADILAREGGETDVYLLQAALLYNIVEDTPKTLNDIEANFGAAVRRIVEEVTDDMTLPEQERKQLQILHSSNLSRRARVLKMADKLHNLRDIQHNPPSNWSLERAQAYFGWASEVVMGCRSANVKLSEAMDIVFAGNGNGICLQHDYKIGDWCSAEHQLSSALDMSG